jgi:hypothetical protein
MNDKTTSLRPRSLWPSEKGVPTSIIPEEPFSREVATSKSTEHSHAPLTAAEDGESRAENAPTSTRYIGWLSTAWKGRGTQQLQQISGDAPKDRVAIQKDPWTLYEARVRLFHGPLVTLARKRNSKAELVAVQALDGDDEKVRARVRQVQRNSHRSFPRLIEFLVHKQQHYLVWEACELSVMEVMASECPVTESEIAEMIWPVSFGLRLPG